MTRRALLHAVAVHEAGHHLVMEALGYTVTDARVAPDGGHVEADRADLREARVRAEAGQRVDTTSPTARAAFEGHLDERATIAAAGMVATDLLGLATRLDTTKDMRTIARIAAARTPPRSAEDELFEARVAARAILRSRTRELRATARRLAESSGPRPADPPRKTKIRRQRERSPAGPPASGPAPLYVYPRPRMRLDLLPAPRGAVVMPRTLPREPGVWA